MRPPPAGNGEDAREVNAEAGKAAGAAVGKTAAGSKDGPLTREDIQRAIEIGERVDRQIEQERLGKIRNRTQKKRYIDKP